MKNWNKMKCDICQQNDFNLVFKVRKKDKSIDHICLKCAILTHFISFKQCEVLEIE